MSDELQRQLLRTFQAESDEHVQRLNQDLLQLERQPDDDTRQKLLQEAFREAHSLKGAARAVSQHEIEQLAHAMETVLQQARETNLALDPATCDVMYDALDAIQMLLTGQSVKIETLISRLGATISSAPAETSAAPESAGPDITAGPGEDTIRVAVSKLDDLMAQAGELVVSEISAEQRLSDVRSVRERVAQWPKIWREIKAILPHLDGNAERRLGDLLLRHHEYMQALARDVNSLDQAFSRDTLHLGMVATRLQDEVRRVRMVPFQTFALGLQRAARDVARSEEKQVVLRIDGGEVELDKKVLEALKDPLLHLLRNSIIHGIEKPDVRLAANKLAQGQIVIKVSQRGSEVHIAVQDDGRGFDLDGLRRAAAKSNGGISHEDMGGDALLALAFQPGITTVEQVTSMAGRGVGLDVVRQRIEELHGRIRVDNAPTQGASIVLVVPVSLTMSRGLLVQVSHERYILPLTTVEKIIEPEDTFMVEGQCMLRVDNETLPLVSLAGILELPTANKNGNGRGPSANPLVIVIGVAEQRLGLLVDDILTEQELAVKTLGKPLLRVRNVEGAALLGTGEPVIVLNAADLIKSARRVQSPVLVMNDHHEDEERKQHIHILVVDDSITTRTLEKNILEAAGYHITTAVDGQEALRLVENMAVDLVVADVQMPQVDGITLTRCLRENPSYSTLPIILVTSLESREDRERGMLAGADAYIIKRGFDQAELLATIEGLL